MRTFQIQIKISVAALFSLFIHVLSGKKKKEMLIACRGIVPMGCITSDCNINTTAPANIITIIFFLQIYLFYPFLDTLAVGLEFTSSVTPLNNI